MNKKLNISTRILIAVAILIVDWLVIFVPLGSLLVAYIIIANPKWFRDMLNHDGR